MGDNRRQNQEINNKLIKEIEEMSYDEAKEELYREQMLMELDNRSLKLKKEELSNLKQDKTVRKYIILKSMIDSVEEEKLKTKQKIELLQQKVCRHDILYITSYLTKTDRVIYKCLCCGKITEEIDMSQVCINEHYLAEKGQFLCGNEEEFQALKEKYEEIRYTSNKEDIIDELHNQLDERNNRKKNTYISLKLIDKKRSS